jgi:predicted ester cyclase
MVTSTLAGPSVSEILERVLDKGIVIDASVRVSVAGIDLMTVDARVVVASLQTFLQYASALHEHGLYLAARANGHGANGTSPNGLGGHGSPRRGRPALRPVPVEVVREAFEAWNGHDVARYVRLLDPGYVSETHRLPTLRGRRAASEAMATYFKVLPDFHFLIQDIIVTGDDVLVSWVATGTPRDEYNGATLTAHPLQVPGCTVTRLRHRKIVHTWNYWDTPTFTG